MVQPALSREGCSSAWQRANGCARGTPRGIGLAADQPRAHDPAQGQGANLLGFALMQVRATLAGC
jgi:predicted NAD-dependent protein-ADP-ribosyltransferase YbiA (DUF1768 family)